jgi:hypothetical protein
VQNFDKMPLKSQYMLFGLDKRPISLILDVRRPVCGGNTVSPYMDHFCMSQKDAVLPSKSNSDHSLSDQSPNE